PEIVGKYMGNGFKQFMCVFTVLLMVLVGAVFVSGLPALFMTMVTSTYIALAPEMFALSANIGYITGAACTVVAWAIFLRWQRKEIKRFGMR
ncbi:MAG: hypothetical protein FWH59_04510, partial [Lentimicrobiaceae bacterium]|nr:hypothetical protein [Lentimicrobiaceae bacterium]